MTSDDKRVMSGFPSLDKITGGFRPGTVNVIAGRPGAGKTSFALNVAYNAAVKYNKRVLFYSLEESKDEIQSKIALFASKNSLDTAKDLIFIDDRTGPYEEVQLTLRKGIEEIHPDLIIVDYLELLTPVEKDYKRERAIVASFLRTLATEYKAPVIVLKQLSRGLEFNSDKANLDEVTYYGHNTVVQESDVVIIIWWEGYTSKSREVHLASSRNVHLDVAKNKFGDGDVGAVVKLERAKCKYYEEE